MCSDASKLLQLRQTLSTVAAFTWNDATAKFDQLTAGRIDGELAKKIKEAVRSLDQIQVKDLAALLARVRVS
jgi:hydroxypyruvate isomerase